MLTEPPPILDCCRGQETLGDIVYSDLKEDNEVSFKNIEFVQNNARHSLFKLFEVCASGFYVNELNHVLKIYARLY